MNKQKLTALAQSCLDLADRCEKGEGPVLGTGEAFDRSGLPCCVMGHALYDADYRPDKTNDSFYTSDTGIKIFLEADWNINIEDKQIFDAVREIEKANDCERRDDLIREQSVVAPLRALAAVLMETAGD